MNEFALVMERDGDGDIVAYLRWVNIETDEEQHRLLAWIEADAHAAPGIDDQFRSFMRDVTRRYLAAKVGPVKFADEVDLEEPD